MEKMVREVIDGLLDQVAEARQNKQPGVVKQLLAKIDRIEKREKKRTK